MNRKYDKDWFEMYLRKYPDMPSIVLIRSIELKEFPREFLKDPVLDLCCGDGFFAECLGLQNAYGCDIDPHAIERAGGLRKTYVKVSQCDARDLKIFDDGVFNTVLSNCALEHVNGIDQALASIARVLKAGGNLIMSVPNENLNKWFFPKVVFSMIGLPKYGRRLRDEYNKKQEHINIHPAELWTKKLGDSGLTIEKSFYLFRQKEYRLVTFFESFVIDSFPGPFFRKGYSLLKRTIPVQLRKLMWRKLLKRIYFDAHKLKTGGELFIVASKNRMLE